MKHINILGEEMKCITVLDFEIGKVFQYRLKELHRNSDGVVDHEEFLSNFGHNINCEAVLFATGLHSLSADLIIKKNGTIGLLATDVIKKSAYLLNSNRES